MHCHIGCTCSTFLHCVFLNESSNCLPERMHNYFGCICLTFLHCVFSNAFSNSPTERIYNYTGCICFAFPCCVFSIDISNKPNERMHDYTGHICATFLHSVLPCVPSGHLNCTSQNQNSNTFFQQYPHRFVIQLYLHLLCKNINHVSSCVLVAFVWLGSTMYF